MRAGREDETMIKVAIIEDDPTMRNLLREAIGNCDDMLVTDVADKRRRRRA